MGQPIFLQGAPSEVGAKIGALQRPSLEERLSRIVARAEAGDLLEELQERAERFGGLLQAITPHWLAEAAAIASAAGVDLHHLLALNCLPSHFWGEQGEWYQPAPLTRGEVTDTVNAYDAEGVEPVLGGDCTTFFALGEATLANETLLHKNREERDETQCVYIKGTTGSYTFVGGGDVGNLGTAHLHTSNLWAGANNTGSTVTPGEYQDCAMTDSHVLRYLAERCASLGDIVPALSDLVARSALGGGGPGFGMILIFADSGRGLIVEATSRHLESQWFEDDAMALRTNHFVLPEMQQYALPASVNSTTRYARAQSLWLAQRAYASIPACGEIARDRQGAPHAICRNPSDALGSVTVSTSTATISSHEDRCQTHFRNCHPSYTPGVILAPLERVSDSDLVSGRHNQHWRAYRGDA